MGFSDLGRTEKPLQELNSKDKMYMNDELGVTKTFTHSIRFEFLKFPFFDDMELKPTWYTEFMYYPKDNEGSLMQNLIKYT